MLLAVYGTWITEGPKTLKSNFICAESNNKKGPYFVYLSVCNFLVFHFLLFSIF